MLVRVEDKDLEEKKEVNVIMFFLVGFFDVVRGGLQSQTELLKKPSLAVGSKKEPGNFSSGHVPTGDLSTQNYHRIK